MFILFKNNSFFIFCNFYTHNFIAPLTRRKCLCIFLLRMISKFILFYSTNIPLLGYIFSSFAHRKRVIHFSQFFIGKTPTNCGVVSFCFSAPSPIAFGSNKRCSCHTFYSTSNIQHAFTTHNSTTCIHNTLQATCTQSVYSISPNSNGQTCQQCCHSCNISIVFSCLIGCSCNYIFNHIYINRSIALH